ncbi:uncharacterized protein ISCGN_022128 [Ixodes scapularis]
MRQSARGRKTVGVSHVFGSCQKGLFRPRARLLRAVVGALGRAGSRTTKFATTMGTSKWAFLLAILTCIVAVVDCADEDSDLENYFKQKIDTFKLRLHEAFERARIQRHKRTVGGYNGPDDAALPQQHLRIVGTRPANLGVLFPNVTYWEPVDFNNNKLVLVATQDGKLRLLQWTKGIYAPYATLDTRLTTIKVKAFAYGEHLWLVCLHQTRSPNDQFVRLYQLRGKQLVTKQTITLGGESDIDVVRGSTAHHLVTCVFKSLSGSGVSYDGKLVLYEWKNTQFDAVSQHSVVGAKSVVAWSMDGPLFIALAQQRDNEGELFMGSPVFMYNQRREHELSYVQVMRLWQAFKVNHFTVAGIHYLTFLTKQGVFLYWYSGDQFLEWQTLLDTENADNVEVFNLPNGEAAIAVVRKDEVMFFLESESATYNHTFTLRMSGVVLSRVSFQWIEGSYYLYATHAAQAVTKVSAPVQLVLESFSFASSSRTDPLLQCLHGLEGSLSRRQKNVDRLAANIGRVWTSDRQKPLAAEMVIIDGPVRVLGSASAPKAVITPGAQRVPGVTPDDVAKQIEKVKASVAGMENDLKNVVYKSVPQTIRGNLKYTRPVGASNLRVRDLSNSTLNGVPLADLFKNTLKITGNQILNQPISFGNLYVNQLTVNSINSIKVSDVMMTNKDQVVVGNLRFGHVAMTDLLVAKGHKINDVDPSMVVTTDTPQTITGRKNFAKLNVPSDLHVLATTNGRDLSDFARKLVPLHGNSEVTGTWSFQSPLTVGSGLHLKHPIDGKYSIPALYAEAVDKHSHQIIGGAKSYDAPVTVRGNVEVGGTLNGIRPNLDLVTLGGDQTIGGTWTVKDAIHFKKNLNTGSINGLNLAKEAVRRSKGPQIVYGTKIFGADVNVTGDITMTPGSTIDGVDPSELGKSVGRAVVYDSAVSIESMVVVGNVVAQKGINDHMLRDLQNLVWLKSINQDIKVPVKFDNVHVEGDVDTDTINGISLDQDIVKTFGDELLEGPVTFKDSIYVKGPVELAPGVPINGVDLSEAAKLVARAHRNGVIHGNVSFPSFVVQKNIHCETVNGRSLQKQYLLVGGEQVMSGTPAFSQPISVKHLGADSISPVLFNGVDFKGFLSDVVLQNSSRQGIVTNKHFAGGVDAFHLQSSGSIDGVNVAELLNGVALLNVPQDIKGTKTFQSPLRLKSLLANKVNGMDIGEHVRRVVRRDEHQVITGKKTVQGRVLVGGHVTTHGPVNGVHMKDLYARAMSRSQENLVSAPMTFLGGIDVEHLQVYDPAKLDGIQMKNVVLLKEDSVLGGNVVFKSLLADGHTKVSGLVNGCNLTKLYEDALYLNGNKQRISGEKHFAKLTVKGNVNIRGPVNGVPFDLLVNQLVVRNGFQAINGPMTFVDGVSADSLVVAGPVNSINLTDLLHDAVTKSTEQVIQGTKTFTNQHGLEISDSLHVHGSVHSRGLVGGIRIEELGTVVTGRGHHEIGGRKTVMNAHIAGNVFVQGKLNGLRIPGDLVLLKSHHEHIPGKTILAGPATIRGNLNTAKVNDVSLDKLLAERVTLRGTQRVRSKLVFQEDVSIQGNFQALRINSIPREHLVLQSAQRALKGTKTFVQDVEVEGDLRVGRVNGFDLVELAKDLVLVNRPEEIPHNTVFAAPIEVQGDIDVVGTVNGMDVHNLQQHFASGKQLWSAGVQSVARTLQHQGQTLHKQYSAYKGQATVFTHFELFQTLEIPSRRILTSPVTFTAGLPWTSVAADVAVFWTARPTHCHHGGGDCCNEFSSEILNVAADGTLHRNRLVLHRRYFPFAADTPEGFGGPGFVAWTNSTSSRKGCDHPGTEEFVVGSLDGARPLSLEQNVKVGFRSLASPFVSDIKVFQALGDTYMAVAHSFSKYSFHGTKAPGGRVDVLRHLSEQNRWTLVQSINGTAAVSIDVVEHRGTVLLSIANCMRLGLMPVPSVVYRFDKDTHIFMAVAELPTSLPSSTLFVGAGAGLAVVFANEKAGLQGRHGWVDAYTEPVGVYVWVQGHFQLLQNIPLPGVNCLERFHFAGEAFLVLGSRHAKTLAVYQWRGYSKFEAVQSIAASPVALQTYWSRTGHLFLAIGSECGKTTVLRAVQQGQCLAPMQRGDSHLESMLRRIA